MLTEASQLELINRTNEGGAFAEGKRHPRNERIARLEELISPTQL